MCWIIGSYLQIKNRPPGRFAPGCRDFGLKPSRGSDAVRGVGEGWRGDVRPFMIIFAVGRLKWDVAVSFVVVYRAFILAGDALTSRSMVERLYDES